MYMSAAACLICAIILSRNFKFYILIPASFLVVVAVCLKGGYFGHNLSRVALEAIILLTSLQVGYVFGLLLPLIPAILGAALKAPFGGVPAPSLSFHAAWAAAPANGDSSALGQTRRPSAGCGAGA
ncbi:protein of unknown function [Methylocella tundrae]|uniref:Uncharacterized protein n=1 Tax=Methylocella tundrae TaxID=227605 RepID=A0A4U8Z238_METTU|nr:protein of unknown function [Methylocella tundrae]